MPTPADGAPGRRRAIVVATGSYTDPTLSKLRAPGRDASEFAAVLEDAALGGFEVETVLDAPADALRRRVAQFCAQGGPGDLALVYLSCHGVLDDRGRLYYATVDTDRALLAATAVPSAWLNEQLEDCRARRQILVLDCCHSGAFAKGAKGESGLALRERFEGRGRVVLTGSRATEYSFEHDHVVGEGMSSVFTRALVEGLRSGDADRDRDGLVTVSELYDYAYEAVRAGDARQTPTLWTYGAEGDLLVAHSPRGAVVEPAPLPEDLVALLESARPRVREGAVAELADLLTGPDAGRALTARAQLERVAAEDVPSVAAAARAALDAAPAPAQPDLPPPAEEIPPRAAKPATARTPRRTGRRKTTSLATATGTGMAERIWTAATHHRRRAIAAAGIVVVGGAVAIALLAGGTGQSTLGPGKIETGGEPRGVAVGEGAIWVARHGDDKVDRIDPASGDQEEIDVGADPDRIAAGEGWVWVTGLDGKKLIRINPRTHEATKELSQLDGRRSKRCDGCPNPGLEIGEGALWTASSRAGNITKRDPHTGEAIGSPYELPSGFSGAFAVGDGAVWAVGADNDHYDPPLSWLARIDAETGHIDRFRRGTTSHPIGVAAYEKERVWIVDSKDPENSKNTVTAFDPRSKKDVGRVELKYGGITSDDIAATAGAVLAWNPRIARLIQIDPNTIKVTARRDIPGYTTRSSVNLTWSDLALDVDDNSVWVTDPMGGAVYKLEG